VTPRPIFTLTLRPEPHVEPIRALRRALKILLRNCGLRVISIHEHEQDKREAA
jgi:hypothetical protein